ncbi:hypothetical protein [Brevibacterium litoralis]|uniref:hypothetical protein n=1 Tax=Brevibacterium litoralis TaxID=3138935 RepID=UPI0032EB1305
MRPPRHHRRGPVPCGSARTLLRPALLAPVLVTVLATAGCGPDDSLRVESTGVPEPVPAAVSATFDESWWEPFDGAAITEEILEGDSGGQDRPIQQVRRVLQDCEECMEAQSPLFVDDQKFQLVHVKAEPGAERFFAGLVVGDAGRAPEIELTVTGHDLRLTPGRDGNLVKEEQVFTEDDDQRGAVTLYDYRDGSFRAGQRLISGG